MSHRLILGIDTSNYRTSLCLINLDGEVVAEQTKLLTVKQGERGLQQSEAVFQHIHRLPQLASQLQWESHTIVAVAASTRPRPMEGSYMPVFTVGESWGKGIAMFLNIPFIETSHQEMHIAAGEYAAKTHPKQEAFLAFHLSGGTSELLACERISGGYRIDKIGGTLDLHAGQLVDRVGVALGLSFPAGPQLEKLAQESHADQIEVPSPTKGADFYLSGAETQLLREIKNETYSQPAIARAIEVCIARSLEKTIRFSVEQGHPKEVLIVGGVAANRYIKKRLQHRLEHRAVGCTLYFCPPKYAGDNAFGTARIGLNIWKNSQ